MADEALQEGGGPPDEGPRILLASLEALGQEDGEEQQLLLQHVLHELQERQNSSEGPLLSQEEFAALCCSLLLSPAACSSKKLHSSSWRCSFSRLQAVAAKAIGQEAATAAAAAAAALQEEQQKQLPLLQQFCLLLQETIKGLGRGAAAAADVGCSFLSVLLLLPPAALAAAAAADCCSKSIGGVMLQIERLSADVFAAALDHHNRQQHQQQAPQPQQQKQQQQQHEVQQIQTEQLLQREAAKLPWLRVLQQLLRVSPKARALALQVVDNSLSSSSNSSICCWLLCRWACDVLLDNRPKRGLAAAAAAAAAAKTEALELRGKLMHKFLEVTAAAAAVAAAGVSFCRCMHA